jgi:hypothetical protein
MTATARQTVTERAEANRAHVRALLEKRQPEVAAALEAAAARESACPHDPPPGDTG